MATKAQRRAFVDRMNMAVDIARQKGAQVNRAAVVAQAALESNWGLSGLTRHANNLFGIKAGSTWRGEVYRVETREWSRARGWYRTVAVFRKYASWNECIVDYVALIERLPWFRDALPHASGRPSAWIGALLPEPGQYGWATDPVYFQSVARVGAIIAREGGPVYA